MRKVALALIAMLLVVRSCSCRRETPAPHVRVATFNIENFPKHSAQIRGAFEEIKKLRAPIVAVQEITNTEVFITAAKHRLGESWRFEFVETGSVLDHRIGVLFDSAVVKHVKTRVHDETKLEGQHKPVFDAEFRIGDAKLRVLVVHFKAGGENHPVRTRQYAALKKVIERVKRDGMPIILLGDFNSTGNPDREDLAHVPLTWLTEPLVCSAFWNKEEEGCPRSRLDHVLSTQKAKEVRAAGACETEGCGWQDRCPLYSEQVSDHCPVVVEL